MLGYNSPPPATPTVVHTAGDLAQTGGGSALAAAFILLAVFCFLGLVLLYFAETNRLHLPTLWAGVKGAFSDALR